MEKVNYNINYSYTTYLALLMNLRFNNSRKIELSVLKEYPKKLVKVLNGKSKEYYITMVITDDDFEKFLEENRNELKIDDKYLYLDENIPIEALYNALEIYDYPFTSAAVFEIRFNKRLRRALKLNGIKKVFDKQERFEDYVKSLYLSFAYKIEGKDYKDAIKDALETRNDFYHTIMSLDSEFIDDAHAELSTLDDTDPFENCSPLDSMINYREKFQYGEYTPDEVLNDIYMFTVFLESSNPCPYRMYEDVNTLKLKYAYNFDTYDEDEYRKNLNKRFMKDALETHKINYTPRTRTQLLFYLKYIKCLDELMDKYGSIEEIEIVKYKLIYLLDNCTLELLEDGNIDKEYNRLMEQYEYEKNFSEEDFFEYFVDENDKITDMFDFYWYQVLIKAFIVDIFESDLYDENLKLKKLAMIKTYYSVTKDEEIIKLLNKYSDHPDFWEYRKYICDKKLELIKK